MHLSIQVFFFFTAFKQNLMRIYLTAVVNVFFKGQQVTKSSPSLNGIS